MKVMIDHGFVELAGHENFKANIDLALERAEELLEPLRGRKIYIIDRNDMTEETVTLTGVLYRTLRPQKIPFD